MFSAIEYSTQAVNLVINELRGRTRVEVIKKQNIKR